MAACICNGIQAFSVEFLPALGLTDWTKGGLRLLSLLAVSATPSLDQECLDAGDWDDLAAPGFRRLIGSDMLVIYCSKEVLSVCLSAVVAGLEEVAGWIGECPAEFRALSRRSVLLVWHFCTCCGLHSLFIEQGDRMNWRLKLRKTERGGNPDSLWNELEYDSPNRKQRKILRAGNALKSKNRSRRAL